MIKPGFNEKSQLLESRFPPTVSVQDIFDNINYLAQNKTLPRDLSILEDGRGTRFNFTAKEVKLIGEKFLDLIPHYTSIHHAAIHDSPINTVYAILLSQNYLHPNYSLEVFATRNAALKWLNSQR